MKITWLGHGSFKLETRGCIVYLDPWLRGNPACPIKIESVTEADMVCVTHGHIDHLGDSIEIIEKTGGIFVGTPELGFYAQGKGISLDNLCPLNIGGSATIRGVKVIMTDAVHTSDIMISDTEEVAGSGACGYVLVTEDDVRIYFAGDTGVFGDMRLINELYKPQVAIMPIGGKYTMGIREATTAARLVGAEVFIPMHYNTFPDQMADLEELKDMMKITAPHTQLVTLKPGEHYTYPPSV